MASCEQFERNYQGWKSGRLSPELQAEMSRHILECPDCAALTEETGQLRALLGSLPKLEPTPGFEYQLQNRLRESPPSKATGSRASYLIPRWAALGAGLVTGVVVGVTILVTTDRQTGSPAPTEPIAVAERTTEAPLEDTLSVPGDTTVRPERLYSPDRHSQVVSTDR